jgi:opacity protein-like surface antigen
MISVPAAAQEGVYLGIHAGANFKHSLDGDITGPAGSVPFSLSSHTGFMVGGTLGYRWDLGLRFEGEVTYRRVANDDVSVGASSGDLNGNQDSVAFMLNGVYDFRLSDRWRPYVGVGVGVSVNGLKATSLGSPKFDFVKDSSAAFAYQGIAGLDFNLSKSLSLGVQYKAFGTSGVDYKFNSSVAPNTKASADPQFDHSVVLTFKVMFGNGRGY